MSRLSRTFLLLCLFATESLSAGDIAPKKVFLTFDDGPQKGTADVLDVLKELNAPAVFFITGENQASLGTGSAPTQKALVERMLSEGHYVGNHGYSHAIMTIDQYKGAFKDLETQAQKSSFKKNFDDNSKHFQTLLGDTKFKFTLARLPGDGRTFPRLVQEVENLGMKHFSWQFEFAPNGVFSKGVPNNNWQGIEGVAASHASFPKNDGDIILFHDRHWKDRKDSLKKLLEKLKHEGFVFSKP